ncbi:hypothetical protein [Pseudomonas donghuensis]|uniref:hypothetical protein n=1 Tax=Pseudomonas donghuensis TaxID=1163398 RepID=UPI0020C2D9BF|nr:hypothetical protein [Pseudomonas donghuensis]MCP6691328.1 hypothetical protein [Pseudomonas donghuensis]
MPLTKPNQELRRDLQGLASDMKWSAVELMRIAERLSQAGNEADAQAVLRMCRIFHDGEERLVGYAQEAHLGLISRSKTPVALSE